MGIFEIRFILADLGRRMQHIAKATSYRDGACGKRANYYVFRVIPDKSASACQWPRMGAVACARISAAMDSGTPRGRNSASAWPLISSEPHSAIERGSKCTHVPMRNDRGVLTPLFLTLLFLALVRSIVLRQTQASSLGRAVCLFGGRGGPERGPPA